MSQLVEHDSLKAARILGSTRQLVLEHGIRKVTIAEIAQAAGVGKGTVYLYWPTKEDLILGLLGRELLASLAEVIEEITRDPTIALPRRLAPALARTTLKHPLARRLLTGDSDLARLLTQHPTTGAVFTLAGPNAMSKAVLPVLRRHGLVRDDRTPEHQAYAVHAVLTGFLSLVADSTVAGQPQVVHPDEVLTDIIHQLLEPAADPERQHIAAAGQAIVTILTQTREAVLALIGRK